jgi:hypothetical protein
MLSNTTDSLGQNRYQAKDIQKCIKIPKHRYSYLATKIGIEPEIEPVDGTGHVNIYSIRNLLQFAYADYASNLGLSPKTVKSMLIFLDGIKEQKNVDIYDCRHPNANFILHFVSYGERTIYKDARPLGEETKYFVCIGNLTRKKRIVSYFICKGEREGTFVDGRKRFGSLNDQLLYANYYVTFNLSVIRKRILKASKF